MRFHNTRVSSCRGVDTVNARKSPPTVDWNSRLSWCWDSMTSPPNVVLA